MDTRDSLDTEDKVNNAIDWINALARREYRQARGAMYMNGSMCCLGVLANECGMNVHDYKCYIHDSSDEPVDDVGLKEHVQAELSERNDGTLNDPSRHYPNHTHPEIAKILLQDPDNYFEEDVADGVKEHFYGGRS